MSPCANYFAAEKPKYSSFAEWVAAFIEADAKQYAADLEAEAQEAELEDWDQSNMPGGDDFLDEIDDGILDALIIAALASILAFLVYYRQMQAHRRRQHQQAQNQNQNQQAADQNQHQQQQEQDGGLFPQPGDPEFMNWAAGGVGH